MSNDDLFSGSAILSLFLAVVFLRSNPFLDSPFPELSELARRYEILVERDIPIITLADIEALRAFYGKFFLYKTAYMWIHPPLLFVSYSFFILLFSINLSSLIHDRSDNELSTSVARIGYTLLTLGMLIGYPWALEAWRNVAWWLDPKINFSIVLWLSYSAYLHLNIYRGHKTYGRIVNVLGIFCFALLVITYAASYIFPGIHAYR